LGNDHFVPNQPTNEDGHWEENVSFALEKP